MYTTFERFVKFDKFDKSGITKNFEWINLIDSCYIYFRNMEFFTVTEADLSSVALYW